MAAETAAVATVIATPESAIVAKADTDAERIAVTVRVSIEAVGGVGTIVGALLGALVMQSLVSGMVLMGIEAPLQDIVVGIVLVLAVTLDTIVRRRSAK